MFWKNKSLETDTQKAVRSIASHLLKNGLDDTFRDLARQKMEILKPLCFEELRSMFHSPPKEGEEYSIEEHGLGGWMSACQFSIFEIVYNCGEDALPFIRENAWGEYDWTQGNAIELLIRLASNGVRREEIIGEIKENFPKIRYEAQLYSIQALLPKLETDENLKKVFSELLNIEDFKESYEELVEENA